MCSILLGLRVADVSLFLFSPHAGASPHVMHRLFSLQFSGPNSLLADKEAFEASVRAALSLAKPVENIKEDSIKEFNSNSTSGILYGLGSGGGLEVLEVVSSYMLGVVIFYQVG